MSKQTLVLIIILFLFTVGLLGLALNKSSYNPKSNPPRLISPAPTKNPFVPDTSLLFGDLQVVLASESATPTSAKSDLATATQSGIKTESRSLTSSKTAKKYLLPIIINTGANNAIAVQLELAFDPNILTDVNINPASFFENTTILINQIDNKNGRISYALGIEPSASESANPVHVTERGKQGEGVLATLTFQAKSKISIPKQTSIIFLPKTFVVAEGFRQSALKSTNSAELKFAN